MVPRMNVSLALFKKLPFSHHDKNEKTEKMRKQK